MEAKKSLARRNTVSDEIAKSAISNIVYFICGILVSKGAVLGTLAPFGASYAAAVPKKNLLSALGGAGLGYILLTPTDSFRYIAVIVAIGGIRWLMSDFKKINESRLFAPLAAFIPIIATGVALMFVSTSTLSSLADCVIEAVLAGAAAYFISCTVNLSTQKRSIATYSQTETASIVLTGCILILSFGGIAVENVSLGRIIAVLVILLCARYGAVTGGAISGIATGAIFSIANPAQGFICGGYAFGGLMSGLFAPIGKFGCYIVFFISNCVMSLTFGEGEVLSGILIETMIAGVVFMVLPKELGNFISPVFTGEKNATLGEALRKNVVMRLDFASKAVSNVKNDVNTVSEKLRKLYSPTIDMVCGNVRKNVCSACGLKVYCHDRQEGVTYDDFCRLEERLEKQGAVNESDVEDVFVKKCCKKREIAESMNENYREYLSCMEAQRRVDDVRAVVAGQFAGVGDILSDLAKEFRNTMRCDVDASERIISALSAIGLVPVECICLISSLGRMSVELELSEGSKKFSKGIVMREVSKCCGRRFDLPTVNTEGNRIRVMLSEMPVYDVEIGSDQHIANNGKLCGECLNYFNDGTGNTYAIVCDGMGTGGRAAVDGNMATSIMSRLLKSGLTPESSLQIANSALMVKSEDESLSTVDVTKIDLFSGRVTLNKAGAPLTYIRKGGRVTTREMPSIPAGILNNIKFSSDTVSLTTGDMVVMVSDGVLTGDEKWLENLIRTWNKGSTQELAHAVVQEAIKHRNDSHDDDITVLAIRLTDNE